MKKKFSPKAKFLLPPLSLVIVGVALLTISHAATSTVAVEAENATIVSAPASIKTDSTASNGAYLQFNAIPSGNLIPKVSSATQSYTYDFPDPYIMLSNGTYYAYATQNGFTNMQLITSTDLVTWGPLQNAITQLPTWATGGYNWAPAVIQRGSTYVMYYTLHQTSSGKQCISVATANSPAGPFVDTSTAPFICQLTLGGSIDPQPIIDTDGSLYLVWKSDNNAIGQTTSLWSQKLSSDGLSLDGTPSQLLTQTAAWQAPIIEGPNMVKYGSVYYLFYGANNWQSANSAIGYATCTGPLGPCTNQSTTQAWLGTVGNAAGPASPATFIDKSGTLRIAYHAWNPSAVTYAAGGQRTLWIGNLTFN